MFICEKNKPGPNGTRVVERQTINAMTSSFYLLAGLFCGTLGAYDYISWNAKKLEPAFEEEEDEDVRVDPFNGNRRNSVRSVNTVATMGTVRSGESQLSERALGQVTTAVSQTIRRRDFRAHIMGERGSPALVVRQPVWSLLSMIALVFLGLTGFIFHASFTRLGRRLDEYAFFVVLVHNVAYSWGRLASDGLKWKFFCIDLTHYQDRPSRSSWVATLFLLIIAGVLDFGMYLYLQLVGETNLDFAILLLFVFMFVIPIFLHWYLRSADITSFWLLFVFAIILFGIGELLRRNDESGFICDPDSIFQAHSVYHMCTAAGLTLLYLFFRSDAWSKKAVDEYYERYPLPPVNNAPNPNITQDLESARRLANAHTRGVSRSGDIEGGGGGGGGGGDGAEGEGGEARRNAAALLASRRSAARRKKASSAVRTGNSEAELKRRILEAQNTTGAEVEAMWTCPTCGYNDNPLENAQCHECRGPRPNLSDMEVIPHSTALNVNPTRPTRNSNKRNSNKRGSAPRTSIPRTSIPRHASANSNKRASDGARSAEGYNQNSRERTRSRERSRDRKKKRFDSLKKQQVIPVAQTTPVAEDEREAYERQRIKTMERVRMRTMERQKQRELLKQKSMEAGTTGTGAETGSGNRVSEPRPPQTPRVSNQRASNQRASNQRASNPRVSNQRASNQRLSNQRTNPRVSNTRLSNSRDRREVAAIKRASQRSAAAQQREAQRAAAQQRRESQRSARASRQRRTTGQGGSVPRPVPLNQQGTGERPRAPARPQARTGGIVPPPGVRKSKARSKTRDKIDDDPPI